MSSFHLNIKSSKTERESWTFLAADEDWCLTVGLAVHSNKQPDGTFCAHPSPSLTFPPNSDTCQILTSDWRISNQAANQRAGLQIRPPSDEGRCGTIMVRLSSKKVSACDSGNICHTIIQRPRESNKSSSPSHFICVVNFEKTIMVSMLSRSWSDLDQSSPLSFVLRTEDSLCLTVRCWQRMRDGRGVGMYLSSQITSEVRLCHVRALYLCWDGSQGVMCHTWRSWHVMPRCHTANICPGVAQHCHNGSRKLGAKLGSSDTSSTNYPT